MSYTELSKIKKYADEIMKIIDPRAFSSDELSKSTMELVSNILYMAYQDGQMDALKEQINKKEVLQ